MKQFTKNTGVVWRLRSASKQVIQVSISQVLILFFCFGPVFSLNLRARSHEPVRRLVSSPKRGPIAGRKPRSLAAAPAPAESVLPGQTVTQLPDGRSLLLGGELNNRAVNTVLISDPRSGGAPVETKAKLRHARAWHTATMLPDGRVLVLGGVDKNGAIVKSAEIFDPETQSFSLLAVPEIAARAYHTATLLTDGQVLVTGGAGDSLIWDFKTKTFRTLSEKPRAFRQKHKATLLYDGNVLLEGGDDDNGARVTTAELFNAAANTFNFSNISATQLDQTVPFVSGSFPADGAVNVPLDTFIGLRFSKPLRFDTLTSQTLVLTGPRGRIEMRIVPAESGRLTFVTPTVALEPGTTYRLAVGGAQDESGAAVTVESVSFTTKESSGPKLAPDSEEDWIPNNGNLSGAWRSNRADSPWQKLPPLEAAPGVTALAGQILVLNGNPLDRVKLQIGTASSFSDKTGRFLLTGLTPGRHVLMVDGRDAKKSGKTYGLFKIGVEITANRTTPLAFKVWMPALDTRNTNIISVPTTKDVKITTPYIPGLEVHIPAGAIVRDVEGQTASRITITPIPIDRPPFPLPSNVNVPVFFTVQPGAAQVIPPRARVVYPNYAGAAPGTRIDFWNYDPVEKGWYIYGQGSVTPDGKQVVPDPGVVIYEFTGFMISSSGSPPATGPNAGAGPCAGDGDPVDLGTGLFVLNKTDLYLPDTIPIMLRRTYRPGDNAPRSFGIGSSHLYNMFLWSVSNYQQADLVLPDGARIHYVRTSPGTGFTDAVYEHTATPSVFYKSRLSWNGNGGWDLRLKDGTTYVFPDMSPLKSIRDRYGNQVTITRTGGNSGNITQITSPNGRWLQFSYDGNNRITQVRDNIGRTINYTYDTSGRLATVTDAKGGVTQYTYDSSNRMLTIRDARNIVFLTNQYDSSGRVTQQTQADSSTYQFAYTVDGSGKITQTDVTAPRGSVRRVTFNSGGYIVSDSRAVGTAVQQTTSIERQAGSHLITAVVDSLGRRSEYVYDSIGNATSVTTMTGTAAAATTTFTYEPLYNQLSSFTDSLNHTTSLTRDAQGNVTKWTDPLNQETTFTYNATGLLLSVTDPLNHTTQYFYDSGDLVEMRDPLGRTTKRFVDAAGRQLSITNPMGHTTRYEFDSMNLLTKVKNPLQGETLFTYDANGNQLSMTDARGQVVNYTYDNMDRLATRTDALQGVTSQESYQYDPAGNLTTFTDRRGKLRTYRYDALQRRTFLGFGTVGSGESATFESSISYSYDSANRLLTAVDSVAGTISRSYDDEAREITETVPQGTTTYTFDALGRRTQMSVSGQQPVSYSYDNMNRLTAIAKGSSTANFTYDNASRRTSQTLPNGTVTEYGYDDASQLTSLTYKQGATVFGDLTYTYDQVGRRAALGGSFARTNLPQALASTTYNNANQLLQFASQTLTYDANGNLTSDGTNTYTWDARDQLASIGGGVTATFEYDAFGRRTSKTVNGGSTSFLYDGVNVIQELSGGTPTANMLTAGVDHIFNRTESTGDKPPLKDALGSIIALTDSTGAIATEYSYEPFGSTAQTGSSSTQPNQFTSRENDNTGLYYYRARYYSPKLQRFISEDPVGLGGGDTNFYAYNANDPINFIDPMGHQMVGFTGGVSGAAGVGGLSAGGTASVMSGWVFTDQGVRVGGAVSGGGFLPPGDYEAGQGSALGASVGVGGGLFVSNASSFSQLGGDFWTLQINTPLISFEYDSSGDTKVIAITGGKGLGASIVMLKTNTPFTYEGEFHPILPGAEPILPFPPLGPPMGPGVPGSPGGPGGPGGPGRPGRPGYPYGPGRK